MQSLQLSLAGWAQPAPAGPGHAPVAVQKVPDPIPEAAEVMLGGLSLRPLQVKLMESLSAAFRAGHKNVMVCAPCGFGKTECATALLIKTKENGKRGAFVGDRIQLIQQTGERFDKYGLEFGVMQASHWRHRPSEQVQLCSIQTLIRREWPEQRRDFEPHY